MPRSFQSAFSAAILSCALLQLLLALPSQAQSADPQTADPQTVSTSRQRPSLSLEEQADLLMARGSYARALDLYKQVEPRSPAVWNKMGTAYHHLFAVDEALNDYKMAVALNPHYAEAYNNIGAVYYSKRKYPAAEKAYKRALRFRPDAAGTYLNLGTLYFAEGKYKQGALAYQQAIKFDPEIFRTGKLQTVEEPASREQRMSTAFYLAEVYASAGRVDEALASLRRALLDGFTDRKRLMEDKELSSLRETTEFHQLLVQQHLE
ncbi:MAG TPA: tetratricopeptide repeat protein [Acidobacteriaceae bacterium]